MIIFSVNSANTFRELCEELFFHAETAEIFAETNDFQELFKTL